MTTDGLRSDIDLEFMVERKRSEEDLAAEVTRLRSEVEERDRTEKLLRAREDVLRKLLGRAGRDGFLFDVEVSYPSETGAPIIRIGDDQPRGLSRTVLCEKAEHVLRTGRPVWYREAYAADDTRRWLRVRLVPVRDADGSIQGIMGRASELGGLRPSSQRAKRSDRLHRELFELLPDAVIITDIAGRLLHINTAGVNLLGAGDASQLLGKPVLDMIHPEDLLRARERGRLVGHGERVDLVEHVLVRLDGTTVPIETLSVPVRYEGRRAVLSTARDVSGRKLLEEALQESRELFYKAFQEGPAGYIIIRAQDGRVLDVNDEYVRITGYPREELIGMHTDDLAIVTDPEQRKELMQLQDTDGPLPRRIYELQRKDGELRKALTTIQRVEVQDEICLLFVLVDVSDQEAATVAERQSRDLLDRVFHASPAAIGIIRRSDGRFIEVNEQWARLTEYPKDDAVGKTMQETDLWGAGEHSRAVQERLQETETLQEYETELRTLSGGRRTVLLSSQQIEVRSEPCILLVLTDITDRKQVEMELIRAKERAEEMSRIKTAFLTNMTHEVRTPLTVILGFTSMLRQGARPEYQRFVRVIERSGRRLLLMLDSILDLAQLEAGTLAVEVQTFNVADVVANEGEIFKQVAEEKGLGFGIDLPNERVYARADHKIFVRVLNNLFDNAVKFTEKGEIRLSVETEPDVVRISMSDTGIGIDNQYLPRVFDEFSQESTGLERTHQGSGLGLAVSRRLLEHMGGEIEAESTKGEGSRFIISFPRVQQRTA
ncbi:MAG TPA: PAS domain S-box protein [Rhodothermales bacterium]|nr:PAS domain S-box protein [Rhodothermales bacterium]